MNLTTETVQNSSRSTIKVSGDVDFNSVDQILVALTECESKTISIDCSGITFIDSTGIGLILRVMLDLIAQGRVVSLDSVPPVIRDILDEMGIFVLLNEASRG